MRVYPCLGAACALVLAAAASGEDRPPTRRAGEDPVDKVLRCFAGEFVTLTPGAGKFPASFRMGPEGEKSQVAITFPKGTSFAVARYEVTQELYEAVMGRNPSKWKGPRNSVEMVSWTEANDFCRKATQEMRKRKLIGEGEVIRLPAEAEWEYACRACTTTRYSFGDDAADLKDYAWFKGNSKGEDPPVGRKKPNAWGLYDMHGYVSEWCADAWHPSYKDAPTDGRAWTEGGEKGRVIRGGSFADPAEEHRSAFRNHKPITTRSDRIGFRCVKAAQPKEDGK
jgi:formylglycine-generating enzyme required for sulfatase activity